MTLHKTIEETKSIFKWAVLTISIFIFFIVLFRIGINIKEHFFPTPPSPPTVSFGKLPPLSFPQNITTKKLTYTINTISGLLPALPDKIAVYPLVVPSANLLSQKRASDQVAKVGFTQENTALSDTLYQWSEKQSPFRTIAFDIVSSNFTLSSNYTTNASIIDNKNLPDGKTAEDIVKVFLTKMSLLPNDIDDGKTKTTFFTIANGQLQKASSQSNALITSVDFFQKDVNNLPIYYPQPEHSIMHYLLTGGQFEPKIVEAAFTHYAIQQDSATYPLKTAKHALKELQEEKAYIASYDGVSNAIQIKNVFLAYYLGIKPQTYLMPIIVFEGDNKFFAYVSAITDEWLHK